MSVDSRINALQSTHPRLHKLCKFLWKVWMGYWFYIILAIFIVIASFAPNFARAGGLIRAEYSIGYGAVAVIFLGSGLSMKTRDLLQNAFHWRAHLTVMSLEFLITSSIMYGFACAIRAANNPNISVWMLVGIIVTACCPTTVSSNVVMTQKADGNVHLTLCEVFFGNVLGAFITPAMVQLYTQGKWAFANPANGASVTEVYGRVMKQIGLSVFVPLFVGQVLQNLFPKHVKWFYTTFKMGKLGSFMLILIMFSSFSTAFYQHSFTSVSHASIIMICFFNFGIYMFFTVICFLMSRPLFLLTIFKKVPDDQSSLLYRYNYKIFRPFYYNRPDTVSVMLCGGAKTAALGVSLITSQYGSDNSHLGELLVPLVLYQAEQVLAANVLTNWMKSWIHAGPEWKEEQRKKQLEQQVAEEDVEDIADGVVDGPSKKHPQGSVIEHSAELDSSLDFKDDTTKLYSSDPTAVTH
ncbi:Solute carrier rch1 [Brettanomyces nanus]|uniref:Solute carrier rch1 n=1 Tax=Eeniella nana TaxID=13502 RepID=A0A875S7U2_EENNA|nr:Solute carrier rch1 [Brettanomyces nanus]QPG77018.1 Solute carrier rch1 [Brettanomyces nanus]